ncbi:hypothetical protein MNBD_ALPHA09-1051 [hydrothermal vent metagenome]|uniref:Phasin domain-containing protein n=1 Tax=hydrothermal vent metagenome TaxID=652676 RepID=A0A3B0SWD6_9ZZZZ
MEMVKGMQDFQSMNKDNMEAVMAATNAWTKGMQAIAAEVADFSKKSFEDSTKLAEKAAKVKSVEAAVALQTSVAKSGYEDFVAQANKIGEMYVAAAKEAYAPIEKRTGKAA